jgi:Anti-sigma-K factor rskA
MEDTSYSEESPTRVSKLPLIGLGIALVLSLIATFTFYSNWRDTEEQLKAAQLANTVYEKDSFRVSNFIQKSKGDREVIADPAYKAVVLRGTGKSPGAIGLLYYNVSTREVFLDINRLPEAPAGLQYQLWAMSGGKAVDAGTLAPEKLNEGLVKLNPIGGAQSFMLTLEKAGGAPAPTASETYLTGAL